MDLSGKHIFIIDDNIKNLQVTGRILKDNGYLISLAQDGQSALDQLKTQIPDLILLDIMMPEIDGLEVCRRIKSDDRLKDIPIIFLTAKNQTEDIVDGFKAGGVDYITKPFNQEELLIRLNTHLELANSRKKIIELNRTRDKLYSIIAHDIRAPFNSIALTIETICSDTIEVNSADFKEILGYLSIEVRDTRNLLNNLLTWTKFQGENITLSTQIINIHKLLSDCAQLLQPLASKKEISIEINLPETTEAYCDEVTMHTVFRNLISNGIKFTPDKGKIILSADINDKYLIVKVTDTGIGISPEVQQKIFEKKEHYTSLGTKNERGTGLGLIVIKEFIEMNKGKVTLSSAVGKGSTFFVSIPLAS